MNTTIWTRALRHSYIGHALATLLLVQLLMSCNTGVETPLRVATTPWPGYESLHLAQSLHYFDADTIRIVDMVNNNQAAMAVRNGSVNAGMLTLDETLLLLQDGIDLQVILVMDISNGADAVIARPEIISLQGLRGKRVAVDNGTVGAVMLDAMLDAANLQVSDILPVSKPVNEHSHAYLTGQIDAAVTFEPVRSELLKHGAHILFDSSQIPGRIVDVLVVRTDAISQHRQALVKLVAACFKALAYQASQPRDAAQRIAPYLGIKPDEVPAQYSGLILPTLTDNHSWLAGPSAQLNSTASNLAKLMLQRHLLQNNPPISHLAQPMFLPANAP